MNISSLRGSPTAVQGLPKSPVTSWFILSSGKIKLPTQQSFSTSSNWKLPLGTLSRTLTWLPEITEVQVHFHFIGAKNICHSKNHVIPVLFNFGFSFPTQYYLSDLGTSFIGIRLWYLCIKNPSDLAQIEVPNTCRRSSFTRWSLQIRVCLSFEIDLTLEGFLHSGCSFPAGLCGNSPHCIPLRWRVRCGCPV